MKAKQIRPEIIGATIQTRKHPTPIKLEQTKECQNLCAKLGLDVFSRKRKQRRPNPQLRIQQNRATQNKPSKMFIYLDRTTQKEIVVTANEGRGTLAQAVIEIEHLQSEKTVTLTKDNLTDQPGRYDRFLIEPADIEDLENGDFQYTIKAAAGGDIDPDITLETGRGRIKETYTETITERTRTEEAVVYERIN